jgi:exonuclease V gamma subunit
VATPPWPQASRVDAGAGSGIDLAALLRFARHPARDMARVLVGYAEDAAPALDDDEDFALDGLGRFRLVERLLDLLTPGEPPRERLLREVRAEGLLPAGHAADAPFDEACERARRLLRALRAGPGLAVAEAPRVIAVSCGRWQLTGSLPILDSRGVVLARAGRWHGQHALELALCATLARMAGLAAQPAWAIAESGPGVAAWRLDSTRLPGDWLARFLAIFERSRHTPLPLWRKSSWAHASAADSARMKAARSFWDDGFRHAGEHAERPCAVLARAFDDPLGAEFEALSLELLAPIAALLEPVRG